MTGSAIQDSYYFDLDLLQPAPVSFSFRLQHFGHLRVEFKIRFSVLLDFQINQLLDQFRQKFAIHNFFQFSDQFGHVKPQARAVNIWGIPQSSGLGRPCGRDHAESSFKSAGASLFAGTRFGTGEFGRVPSHQQVAPVAGGIWPGFSAAVVRGSNGCSLAFALAAIFGFDEQVGLPLFT